MRVELRDPSGRREAAMNGGPLERLFARTEAEPFPTGSEAVSGPENGAEGLFRDRERGVWVLRFVVLGEAKPAGSKRSLPIRKQGEPTRYVVVDANPRQKSWLQEVRHAANEAIKDWRGADLLDLPPFPWGEPLQLGLTFYVPRPKGHFGTGRNAGVVKASAVAHPAKRPDLLKLARGVEDALSQLVYRDDALIVREVLEKRWGSSARVEIEVRQLGHD